MVCWAFRRTTSGLGMANDKNQTIDSVEASDPLFFRKEIKILQFWRGLLGEDQFQRYENDDLVRWYLALRLQGRDDVRARLVERHGSRPMPVVHGVVDRAPHPPLTVVEKWLESEETQVHASPVLLGILAFVILTFVMGWQLSTCSLSTNPNLLATNPAPPALQAPQAPQVQVPVSAGGMSLTSPTPSQPGPPNPPSALVPLPGAVTPPAPPATLPPLANSTGRGH